MRLRALGPFLAATTLVASTAVADIGPPPKCGAGTHHEYLFGHRCVPDGSHLEQDPAGGMKTVADKTAGTATATVPSAPSAPTAPSATPEFASPPVPATAPAADPATGPGPVPPAPPASRGCACGVAGAGGGAAELLAAVVGIAALVRRRRSR